MTRFPSDPTKEDAQGQTTPPCSAPPTRRPPEKAEVAAFIIPEMPIPWDSVIDVRSASRLQIAGFDPPLFVPLPPLPEPLAAPVADTPATERVSLHVANDGVSDWILNAETAGLTMASSLDLERPVGATDDAMEGSSFDAHSIFSPPQQEASRRAWAAMSAIAAGAVMAGLSRATMATRARAAAAWPRVRASRDRITAQMSQLVAAWRPRPGRVATAWTSTTIRAAAGARASLALLRSAIADVAVQSRRHLRPIALAAASVLLASGAALLLQLVLPLADVTRSTGVSPRLAATPLSGVAALAPAIVQRAATIEPGVRDEPIQPRVERVQPPPSSAALVPRRADLTAAISVLPPAANDAVPADLSSAPAERPRDALIPAPFPTPRGDAARASRTDEARIDLSPPPAERGSDRPVPAPFPIPRPDAPRSDGSGLAANDGIAEALKHLELAYERRDATLAKAVWPTVNERALARAFDGLRSQSVTFDRCKMDVAGAAGDVECHGITTYVTRVGSQGRRTESRQWKFRVKKDDDSWLIVSASAR